MSERYRIAEVHTDEGRVEYDLRIWRSRADRLEHRQEWRLAGLRVRGWEARHVLMRHFVGTAEAKPEGWSVAWHRRSVLGYIEGKPVHDWKLSVYVLMGNAETPQDYAICSVALDRAHREAAEKSTQLELVGEGAG
jgi:hypothetical protein